MERGIWVPGPITAGTFYQEGELVFWDVHDPQKTVVIHLKDERYRRLAIEVELAAAIAGLHALQSGCYGRGEISRRLRSSAELRQGGYEVWSPY